MSSAIENPLLSFDYVVKKQRRKTLALHVLPDATVEVRVPKQVRKSEWQLFVAQRADWVIKQREVMLQKLLLQPGFQSGEKHPFLGESLCLQINAGLKRSASIVEGVIQITVKNPADPDEIKKVLYQWYREQAAPIFEMRIKECYSWFPAWFIERYDVPPVGLRWMRRRWGSCSSKGEVTLNTQLIKMSLSCIDYVVVHELCHLAIFNHSPAFYQLMSAVLPDWKARQRELESQE